MNPEAELLAAAKKAATILNDDNASLFAVVVDARNIIEDAIEAFEKYRREAENGPDHDGDAWEGGFAANH